MQLHKRRSRGTTFFRNLFLSAAAIQKERVELEISRLELLSLQLCRALEPIVALNTREPVTNPNFYACLQLFRAIDSRRQRLQLFEEIDSKSKIFDVQEILEAPLLVQTSPVSDGSGSLYAVESHNLESFVGLFVQVLQADQEESVKKYAQ